MTTSFSSLKLPPQKPTKLQNIPDPGPASLPPPTPKFAWHGTHVVSHNNVLGCVGHPHENVASPVWAEPSGSLNLEPLFKLASKNLDIAKGLLVPSRICAVCPNGRLKTGTLLLFDRSERDPKAPPCQTMDLMPKKRARSRPKKSATETFGSRQYWPWQPKHPDILANAQPCYSGYKLEHSNGNIIQHRRAAGSQHENQNSSLAILVVPSQHLKLPEILDLETWYPNWMWVYPSYKSSGSRFSIKFSGCQILGVEKIHRKPGECEPPAHLAWNHVAYHTVDREIKSGKSNQFLAW